jgi:hypothetical protein
MKKGMCFFLLIICIHVCAQNTTAALLKDLNNAINTSVTYDAEKVEKIKSLEVQLSKTRQEDLYGQYLALYNEYQVFNYDSAYAYCEKMQNIAAAAGDNNKIAYSKVKLSFIMLSSGMFKEVFDVLASINLNYLDSNQKAEYYTVAARYYYDLADYDKDDHYTNEYNKTGSLYIDLALSIYPEGSFQHLYYNGLKNIKTGDRDKALLYFDTLMHSGSLTLHQLAVTASTLSDIYIHNNQTDSAIHLFARAAIADIQSSTKETSAAFNLATLLFKKGDLKNASACIEKAVNDATFYGARQRKVQLSTILPLIEAEKLNIVEKEKQTVTIYAISATVLLLVLAALIIIIVRQNNKLKAAERIITEANKKLLEANRIKEEYIGYFFSGNTEFYNRIDKFKKSVEQKIVERKIDEIKFLVNNFNLKKERDELLKNFDQIFLNLFSKFVSEFNLLLKVDEQVKLKEGEILNTDLRIFALIRMGIHDTEKIAAILGYSVNTINTYKTKIKNRSIVANEDFENRIMQINSI